MVGKHEILFTARVKPAESYTDKPEVSPYANTNPKPAKVEVQPGPNEIDVELVRK